MITYLLDDLISIQVFSLVLFVGGPPGPPLPRQVLPRERSYVDKIFESLVGDGPQNRYALICRYCQSHNGMALAEEFEYLGKCTHLNS